MKIAVDLDGTAWKHSGKFVSIIYALKTSGHEVGILTAHLPEDEKEDISLWKSYFGITPDFYIGMNKKEKLIGEFKARKIKENNIEVLFDDFGGGNADIMQTFFDLISKDVLILQVIGDE